MELPPPQIFCVAQAIYAEARGESERGQRAVAHVIINRSKADKVTACTIVHRDGQFQIRFRKHYKGKDWDCAVKYASRPGLNPIGVSKFFRVRSMGGYWRGHKIVTSIGNHNFFK